MSKSLLTDSNAPSAIPVAVDALFLPDSLSALRAQSALRQRLQLTAAQRAEAESLSPCLGISLQQVYRRLRSGELSLTSK
ncbi:Uncharacterised protein [Chromobacterium violaceum]|uniref:Uncharacterized protein n=1 Tax=Chromobacterium violaceum TaxID=536 RepID=A0AAX2M9U3_CHRVL|nr:Uncharacterised protein [Chromobacterium violaceum]SUX32656.1 Uncharacterised protein [Chromobacterium violaceum]